jgi:methionine-rich copper-binding protein CopC
VKRLILLLILPAILTGTAFAHAKLVKADPRSGAQLAKAKAPRVVRLWFSEELDPKGSSIGVWDGHGRRVDDGKGGVDLNDLDRKTLVARLKLIRPGPYAVRWKAVSADDLDIKEGTTRFVVRP